MLKNYQLHIRKIFLAGILLCLLQFFTFPLQAQYDTAMVEQASSDTISSVDEKIEDDDEEAKEYFEYKYDYDSLVVLQRNVPDSITKKMQDDEEFWYANTAIAKKKVEEKSNKKRYTPLGQQTWVKTLIWLIIIGGFAAAIMYYLADSNVGLFRKKAKLENSTEQEVETDDIFAINYQQEIDKAAAKGNYRLAVRLMFLRLLKNMSEKDVIKYKIDKTNFDYLLQLHSTRYYKDFFRITRNYEYTWYGQFDVSEDAYRIMRSDFDQFERNLLVS